ncbi:MAG: phosphoethanolamine--lipid A transferase [Desulfobacterales bacterium]|nr:phosphoethanolamine--lipid A transferase [Desulfobacterales bacterium]
MKKISELRIIIIVSIYLVIFDNVSFFSNVIDVYPVSLKNIFFLGSLFIVLTSVILLLFILVSSPYTTKPMLILVLLLSSMVSYFVDNYHIIIDDKMIQNILLTHLEESQDLFSLKLVLYVFLLGIIPSIFVYIVNVEYGTFKEILIGKFKVIIVLLLIITSQIILFSKFYTSFFREHKPLRYYTNPTYCIYSIGKYISMMINSYDVVLKPIGTDAKIPETDVDRELIILVIGEAARADRFSLNGYERETNPLLKQEDIINFPNMYACGTSTAISLPCMFSIFGRDNYSDKKAKTTQNLLDVLTHAGINVLWRDNNSDSKGVALRVQYQDYKYPENNPICDEVECRDEGMLIGLQEYIDAQPSKDIFIVLHQMGNHGPAYFKRYPKSFEKFVPVCKTNQLESCTTEEINNAYDNAILYTDYFLSKVITLLKQNNHKFETALFFLSDHGESLGENGIYLHGLPYFMAPNTQKHIAALMWFGDSFKLDKNVLRKKVTKTFTQDCLFHTILGLMEIQTSVYDKTMDIINGQEF